MAQYFYATVARMVASVYKQAEIKAAPSSLVFAKDNIFGAVTFRRLCTVSGCRDAVILRRHIVVCLLERGLH